jgi:hypothetical protein
MLGGLFAALRPALAILLFGGAAAVMVAPAFDMASQRAESRAAANGAAPLRNHPDATPTPSDDPNADPTEEPKPDFETLLRQCLESRDPDSDECAAAALESGMSYEDFRAKIVAKLEPEPTKKPEPKQEEPKKEEPKKTEPDVVKKTEPVKTTSFDTLLQKCLESRDQNSEACIRAGEASGLSAEDWAAKVRGKLDATRQSDFAKYFDKCLATRDINSDYCFRAEELSGLSREDFDAKFNAKVAAKDSGDFWTVFEKCLDTRDVSTDICARAQALIGYNDADFQAKFARYLADRDAQAAKTAKVLPTPKPATGTTASFDTLLKACGGTHNKMSEACLSALVMSGLQPSDFWAKLEAKFGTFH